MRSLSWCALARARASSIQRERHTLAYNLANFLRAMPDQVALTLESSMLNTLPVNMTAWKISSCRSCIHSNYLGCS